MTPQPVNRRDVWPTAVDPAASDGGIGRTRIAASRNGIRRAIRRQVRRPARNRLPAALLDETVQDRAWTVGESLVNQLRYG